MKRLLMAVLSTLPGPTVAQGLHGNGGLLAGATHPVAGADHMPARPAVGPAR
jgi:hydrogenase/urease accessory protein HupE